MSCQLLLERSERKRLIQRLKWEDEMLGQIDCSEVVPLWMPFRYVGWMLQVLGLGWGFSPLTFPMWKCTFPYFQCTCFLSMWTLQKKNNTHTYIYIYTHTHTHLKIFHDPACSLQLGGSWLPGTVESHRNWLLRPVKQFSVSPRRQSQGC